MPNRIIKESAFTSDRIAALSDFEFRLWVGLITQADDTGRGDARPAIIKGRVFALRERTTISDIDKALHALAAHGCVILYEQDGKPYYAFPHWADHQRVRDVKSKFPAPPADILPQSAASCGELRPESNPNPIQYESESNPKRGARAQSKPSLDDVVSYVRERRSKVNAQRFYTYYEARGWKGITDWKAALESWENNGIDKEDLHDTAASYDIDRAAEKAKTTVPELKKRRTAV